MSFLENIGSNIIGGVLGGGAFARLTGKSQKASVELTKAKRIENLNRKLTGLIEERTKLNIRNVENQIKDLNFEDQKRIKKRAKELRKKTSAQIDEITKEKDIIETEQILGIDPDGKWKRFTESFSEFNKRNFIALRVASGIASSIILGIERQLTEVSTISQENAFLSDRMLISYKSINEEAQLLFQNGEKIRSSTADMLRVQVALQREYGNMQSFSADLLDNVANLQNVLNLSVQESTALMGTMRSINRASAETNLNLIRGMAIMASNNAVAFRDVMSDIESNAEFFATYMHNSSEEIGRLSIRLRRMGTEIGTIAGILGSFDSIDNIIQRQMTMGIFVGQNIDLMGVASKQFAGDVEGATDHLLKQIQNVNSELLNNPFARRQFAQGLGINQQQLNELIEASEKLNDPEALANEEFRTSIESFNETISSLGFSRLRTEFAQNFLQPIQRLLADNTESVEMIIEGVSKLISLSGTFISRLISFGNDVTNMFGTFLNKDWAGIFTIGFLSVAGGLLTKTTQEFVRNMFANPLDIQRNALLQSIATRMKINTVGGPFATGGRASLARGGIALGGSIVGTSLMGLGNNLTESGNETGGMLASILGGAITGGSIGAMAMNPWTIAGGALIGGVTGAVSHHRARQRSQTPAMRNANGNIFTKPFKGNVEIAEAGRSEAIIPLDTKRGREMLSINLSNESISKLDDVISRTRRRERRNEPKDLNLSDASIKKLSEEMRKMPVELKMNVTNKNNKRNNFISEIINPSSTLTIDI